MGDDMDGNNALKAWPVRERNNYNADSRLTGKSVNEKVINRNSSLNM